LLLRLRPTWLQHLGNHVVLEDDQRFLHWQERVVAQRGGSANLSRSCYLASPADRYVLALHQWVLEHAGPPFPGQALPARLDQEALMERYQSHTKNCRACSGALSTIRQWRPRLAVLPWLGLFFVARWPTPWSMAGALAGAVLAGLGLERLNRWEQLLQQGDGCPPRNQD
jgi:hypothetical protein